MKNLMTGLLAILGSLAVPSLTWADIPKVVEPIGRRILVSGELFGFSAGYRHKPLLNMIDEMVAEGPVTENTAAQMRSDLCQQGQVIQLLLENNKMIESLDDSHPMQVELKTAYKKLGVRTTIVPWIQFCGQKMKIKDTAKAAREKQVIELNFFDTLAELIKKYGN